MSYEKSFECSRMLRILFYDIFCNLLCVIRSMKSRLAEVFMRLQHVAPNSCTIETMPKTSKESNIRLEHQRRTLGLLVTTADKSIHMLR